jgi:hypothetical protein
MTGVRRRRAASLPVSGKALRAPLEAEGLPSHMGNTDDAETAPQELDLNSPDLSKKINVKRVDREKGQV